jgi:signal peptidase I
MNRINYALYKKPVEWEQKGVLSYHDSSVYLNDAPINAYRFQKNYYFVAGDRTEDSRDSRYWGLLPEEYIVGKAWIVWKSVDPYTGKFRWGRFLKVIR